MNYRSPRHRTLDRLDAFIALCAGAASLSLYVRTLLPGLVPNDSAEFQTLAFTLNHAHTTGYEVYLILAKIFTLLVPLGDIAYRVNLFSAFCGGLTVALVYLCGKALSTSHWGALTGTVALAVSATFWSQSIFAEVYTAGSAFTAAVLLLVLLWYREGRSAYLLFAGLLGGLAVGVHGSNSLFAPAIGLLLLMRFRDLRSTWKPALAGTALGLLFFLGAFTFVDAQEGNTSIIQAAYGPSITRWDMQPGDLDSFGERFRFLVLAKQWQTEMFRDPAEVMPGNMGRYAESLARDFALPVLALILIGFVSILLRDRKLGVFFLAALLVHNVYTFNYSIGDIYVFFISAYVYLCSLAAEGAAALLRIAERLPVRARWAASGTIGLVLLILTVGPFSQDRLKGLRAGEIRFDFMNLPSNIELAEWRRWARYNVENLPENAVVLMDWPDVYGFAYTAHVELGRADMAFLEAYPYARKNGMAESMFDFLRTKIQGGHPVYTLNRLDELQRGGFKLSSRPVGVNRMTFVEIR